MRLHIHIFVKLLGAVQCLKPDGAALVAAKTHYFGVGGGVQVFKEQLPRLGKFEVHSLCVFDDGRSNHREIFCLELPQAG